jgi:hypothetical protein
MFVRALLTDPATPHASPTAGLLSGRHDSRVTESLQFYEASGRARNASAHCLRAYFNSFNACDKLGFAVFAIHASFIDLRGAISWLKVSFGPRFSLRGWRLEAFLTLSFIAARLCGGLLMRRRAGILSDPAHTAQRAGRRFDLEI